MNVSQTKAKEIWSKKRLTYKQAIDKIKNTERHYADLDEKVMNSVFQGSDAAKGPYEAAHIRGLIRGNGNL